jgi:cyclopropane fatty-acyl-phospholipid synthase-like methyltransferase
MDPLYAAVFTTLQQESPFPILDIGCGIGLLAFYLRERGLSTPLHGMDFDLDKINVAQSIAPAYTPTPEFHHGDAHQTWPDFQGHVCLLDVLQYLDTKNQDALLEKSVRHVAADGLLIIRSGLQSNHWRYRVTEFSDQLMNLIRLMKSPPIAYPTQGSLEQALANQGMRLRDCRPLFGKTPFNNYLLVFEKS